MKTRMSNRDQVIGAITTRARPMTLYEVYESCDCFTDQTGAAMLLREMEKAQQIISFWPAGERARYGLPGMSFTVIDRGQDSLRMARGAKPGMFFTRPVDQPKKNAKGEGIATSEAEENLARLMTPAPALLRDAPPLADVIERESLKFIGVDLAATPLKQPHVVAPVVTEAPARAAKSGRVPVGPPTVLAILANSPVPLGMALLRQRSKYSKSYLGRMIQAFIQDGKVVSFGSGHNIAYAIPDSAAAMYGAGAKHPAFISEQTNDKNPSAALIERVDDDLDDDLADTFNFLREYVSPVEFQGFVRCNLMLLSMRGTADDMSRLQAFSKALAGVV